ncbi:hypothetical protein HHL22_16540 [Hymenobacter sp. RP-2-7]|uniref:Uncharacterized protein n=1 Tax=Hymenobacter polaris TaxID=2682546 RepID=A0A7Y0AGR3_9BACT|nr:hypothetical protein [Hymenobacter polaris]NML66815.1 hypothetical protein [Hymenobacter polaris]
MLENLSNLLTVVLALSVASERLVAIVKNLVPWLRTEQPRNEATRKLVLQVLAVLAGIATAFLAQELLAAPLQGRGHLVVLGLLASGGSGFWKSVLGYVSSVQDIKRTKAVETKVQAAHAVATIARSAATRPAAPASFRATDAEAPQPTAAADQLQKQADANLAKAIALANATL